MKPENVSSREAELQELEAQLLLLESLKASQAGEPVVPLRRQSHSAPPPLSFAQERLWLIDQLMPGSSVYNVPAAVRLRGALRVDVLARCFAEIIRRHEALRTTFHATDGSCRQVIAAPSSFALPVVDLWVLAGAAGELEVRRLSIAESDLPFDLQTGPLLRATLLVGAVDQVVLFTMHHIVSDGWSTAILMRELVELYQAFCRDRLSPLPELEVQYADYAVWQRQWLSGKTLEREIDFWLTRLADLPSRLELPADRPYPPAQTFAGAGCSLALAADLTARARALARRNGATLFIVLLAAFEGMLARSSGQQDFGLGTPVLGRHRPEIEGLIGFFVNTLVLRSETRGEPTFRELLGRVRASALEAFDHQHLPFEMLVEKLAPERNLAHSPLFQVMFALETTPVEMPETPGLVLSSLGLVERTAKFELTLSVVESADVLTASLQYNLDLFDAPTARRMLECFQSFLTAAVKDLDLLLSALPLLSAAERHQLIVEWNDTAFERRRETPLIHRLFEEQADRTPDAVAASFRNEQLTYRQLDELSSRLAHRLRRLGVGPEVRVAISMERSLDLVGGLIGILKAGGAFAPLDPHDPEARLANLLADLGSPVVVTLSRHRERFSALTQVGSTKILCLDGDRQEILAESAARPEIALDRWNLAYVVFTSGSTGVPKGAMNGHGGIVNRLLWIQDTHPLEAWDRVLQKTPFTFDVSIWELFWPLLNGACLVVAEPGGHQDPAYLVRLVAQEEVTTLHFVASMLRVFLEEPDIERCASVRRVIASGEALAPALARQFAQVFTAELLNLYGPTEAAVEVTCWRCEAAGGRDVVPIGRPIANVKIRVLDCDERPVPIGTAGELHIGGIAPARGYLGRPDLTAERFVPDSFGPVPGARLYRTGDRARLLPDGAVDYLGRLDRQVKIRGFRIELGEIESTLLGLDGVREAAVVVRSAVAGGGELVACVVEEGPARDPRTLQGLLAARLPAYMVPRYFIFLEGLPLTTSGKVDRKSLAERSITPARHADGRVASSRTPLQELLAGVFAEVLGIEQVGLDDSFFELGGHSLLATRVVARLRHTLGLELPLRALFEAPTVSRLAERIAPALPIGRRISAPPLRQIPRDGELPLSFAQHRLWVIDRLEPGSPLYNIPTALRLSGRLLPAVLSMSLGEVVRRHEVLRTRFETDAGRPRQMIGAAAPVALPMIDLSEVPDREEEARRLAAAEALRTFDLASGPLLRAGLLRLGPAEHVALITIHHIVADGWSLEVLVREVAQLYAAFEGRHPSPLPELPIQYVDFASWQRGWLVDDVLEEHLSEWRQRLAGTPAAIDLPTDRPRSAAPSHSGGRRKVPLPVAAAEEVRVVARREGATLFMTLLAAFQTLLSRWSGQEDLTVGTPIAGRNRLETEGLIGLFVNTLVLRSDLSGAPTFRELLGRVRETTLAAYAHQDVPFERLVEELHPERSLARTPLFQVMLVLQNTPGRAVKLPGVTISTFDGNDQGLTAKFELALFVEDFPGLPATLLFRRDLFDDATVERMAGHLVNLLAAAIDRPEAQAAELPCLGQAEEAQLLTEWNPPPVEGRPARCVHELFEEQADRVPGAVAVRSEGVVLTYSELERRANRLAHLLQAFGVGPEVRVGLLVERSVEMMVGLLGILKSGGAYLPLDRELPGERLAFMLEDAEVPVVVTDRRHRGAEPLRSAQVICLDDGEEAAWPERRLVGRATPAHLAYVIYTSGSTGRPKGVAVEHRQVASYLAGVLERLALPAGASFATVSTLAADLGNTMIFAALSTGGSLHVLSDARLTDPEALADYLAHHDVDCLKIVPSHLAALAAGTGAARLLPRRLLVLGGEASNWSFVDGLQATGCRMLNHYGPTETTIGVTTLEADWSLARRGPTVPLGRPLSGTRIYVLDALQRPVPIGMPGELCVGGSNVTRGYLRRPDLTAEKFMPDAFGGEPGGRLYRTGDLARHLVDGKLEFLGRIDLQVKVRGYRVEVKEVESVLHSAPGVRAAVVLARPTLAGGRRLVAYVVAEPQAALTANGLRDLLAAVLPEYMVPSALVLLDALPLTPNGKVDRTALAGLEEPGPAEGDYVAPRDPVEEALARIWAEILRLERVGTHDNYFALGGDSILSIQIASLAQQAGLRLTPKQVFEHQTIAALAAVVGFAPSAGAEQGAVTGPVPLTPIQCRFFSQDLAEPEHFNKALLLAAQEPLAPALLAQAVRELLRHHDALRLRLIQESEGWRQVSSPSGPVPFHVVDLASLPSVRTEVAAEAVAAQVQTSLDLRTGPLLRVVFFTCWKKGEERLLLVAHHLALDDLSSHILLGDLETAYSQRLRGEAVHLAAKTTSFKRWAERLAEHATSDAVRAEEEFWLVRAAPLSPPSLPLDGHGKANTVASARELSVSLSAEQTRRLVQEVTAAARAHDHEILLAALALAFSRWTGKAGLLIDLENHGREEIFEDVDLTRTVGWFTARFPIWLELGMDGRPAEALSRIKDQIRSVPGHGISYGLLRYLGDQGSAARLAALPQASVIFSHLGNLDGMTGGGVLFQPAGERVGPTRSQRGRREHLLEIVTSVVAGRLLASFTYSVNAHHVATIEDLAGRFLSALEDLVEQCGIPGLSELSVSDFPLVELGRDQLADVLQEVMFEESGD